MIRRWGIVFTLLALVGVAAPAPAGATQEWGVDALVIGVSVSPGISNTPTFQSGTMTADMWGRDSRWSPVSEHGCWFTYNSTSAETNAAGAAVLNGRCVGVPSMQSCGISVVRVGPVAQMAGSCLFDDVPGTVVGQMVWLMDGLVFGGAQTGFFGAGSFQLAYTY
jgi:hypothetical protein